MRRGDRAQLFTGYEALGTLCRGLGVQVPTSGDLLPYAWLPVACRINSLWGVLTPAPLGLGAPSRFTPQPPPLHALPCTPTHRPPPSRFQKLRKGPARLRPPPGRYWGAAPPHCVHLRQCLTPGVRFTPPCVCTCPALGTVLCRRRQLGRVCADEPSSQTVTRCVHYRTSCEASLPTVHMSVLRPTGQQTADGCDSTRPEHVHTAPVATGAAPSTLPGPCGPVPRRPGHTSLPRWDSHPGPQARPTKSSELSFQFQSLCGGTRSAKYRLQRKVIRTEEHVIRNGHTHHFLMGRVFYVNAVNLDRQQMES